MSKRILIVDDSKFTRNMLLLPLERAGYTIDTASDPQEAVSLLATSKPDLVITDLKMPSLNDGLGFLKMISLEDEDLPVMIYTAETGAGDAINEIELTRVTLLKKPVAPNDLVLEIKNLFD